MRCKRLSLFPAALILLAASGAAMAKDDTPSPADHGWGALHGRFVLGGPAPAAVKLLLNKDAEVCSKSSPADETLVIDAATGGIANVVLWLDLKRGETVPIHPSFEKTAAANITLDNQGCRFNPHICVLRTSQTLVAGNKDPIAHNAALNFNRNDPANLLVPIGGTVEKKVPVTENIPVQVTCSIHPWMRAHLVVKDHPYVAVTDREGNFEIRNLPAGERRFRIWHESSAEKSGYVSKGMRDGALVEWEKGAVSFTIREGANEFGKITLAPEIFVAVKK